VTLPRRRAAGRRRRRVCPRPAGAAPSRARRRHTARRAGCCAGGMRSAAAGVEGEVTGLPLPAPGGRRAGVQAADRGASPLFSSPIRPAVRGAGSSGGPPGRPAANDLSSSSLSALISAMFRPPSSDRSASGRSLAPATVRHSGTSTSRSRRLLCRAERNAEHAAEEGAGLAVVLKPWVTVEYLPGFGHQVGLGERLFHQDHARCGPTL
jgi:hypothetical protein